MPGCQSVTVLFLPVERPDISVERLVRDPALEAFGPMAASRYRHTAEGWRASG